MIGMIVDRLISPLGAALAVIVAVIAAYLRGRKAGRNAANVEALRDVQERLEQGRKAVLDGREHGDPVERLRRNDGHWR